MKKMKKIVALLIAMVMVFGMSMSVFAASIEITHDKSYEDNVDPDETEPRVYEAYKIFDASYDELAGENSQNDKDSFAYDPDDAAVSYSMTADNPWVDVMKDAGQTWFDVAEDANGNYVVTPKVDRDETGAVTKEYYTTSDDALAFAEYLKANIPTGATATEVTVDGAAVDVDPGYYLIVAKDGKDAVTKIALVTTDVTMVEKNTYLGTKKETEETSYSVGDIIEYTASVTIPEDTALTVEAEGGDGYKDGHGPVILHDEMDAVLAFDADSVAATMDSAEFTGFTLVESPADACTFELVIPVTEDVLGKTITFTYSAELTSAAVDPDTGFINKFFGEINGYKTIPDEPKVYTFDFDFVKLFDEEDNEELTATFELQDAEGTAIAFIVDADGNYVKADSDDTGTVDVLTMTNNTPVNIQGLAAGTYKLVELSTSTGYNLIDAPVEVTITDTSTDEEISHEVSPVNALGQVEVENHSGTVLPSTGGIGTTMFYVVGSVLVIGAAVLLISKRRMAR